MSAQTARPGSGTDPDDLMVLLFAGMLIGPTVLVFAWTSLVGWLVDHQVLLAAARDPLVVVPASDGAGLDLPRLLLLGALLLSLLAALGSAVIRLIRRRTAEVAQ
ncbi:hypothetical protein GCM10023328_47980 [Modestobacter marinus]|uniref:Uncharacterized protein n=1 Tax=Modestobacter marinus TaxID=477641 RepID=A0A846LRW8_9ACTN|nr:hypothetical protein [Modestobacter marinus]NIH70221.1 hypothetical protein [Modestobacter marinus]GGL85822.1 hypothetical protein GCM10011589_47770 [Modestobacter marinus]